VAFVPFVLLSTGVFVGIIFILIVLLAFVESKVGSKCDSFGGGVAIRTLSIAISFSAGWLAIE